MITAIEIENFKGFGERQRIELAPITLLFGANSAGKSSFFHALFYLRELFAGNDPTPGIANHFSDRVDLGGFRNTVHAHDTQKEIKFRIEFEVGDDSRFGREVADFDLGDGVIAIEVSVGSAQEGRVAICRYAIERSEERFALAPKFLPMISLDTVDEAGPKDFSRVELTAHVGNLKSWLNFEGGYEQAAYHCRLKMNRGALPSNPRTIHSPRNEDCELTDAINGALFASREYIKTCLEDLYYIGPWREVPNSQHIPNAAEDRSRWAGGLAAWDMIMDSISDTFQIRLDYWLGHLLGIHIERERLRPEVQYSDRDFVDRLVVVPAGRGGAESVGATRLRVQDVGYGVSQVVPFVVALLKEERKTVAIEQPELHLHPKLQTELGDLLISECVAGPLETQAVVETHSEHLLLRILRRIRETTDEDISSRELECLADQVAVHYFESSRRGTRVLRLRVNSFGEFIDRWPSGFFDERMGELF